VPNEHALWIVAQEFGFWGSLKQCSVWPELLIGHGYAMNVVQPLEQVLVAERSEMREPGHNNSPDDTESVKAGFSPSNGSGTRTPYVGFSNQTLDRLPAVKPGDEITCGVCGKRHALEAAADGSTLLLFYKCGETLYLGAVRGRSVVGQKAFIGKSTTEDG
jgi:hypothetical protein